ncbi:MAG: site-2 protease family protein [Clostridia bacterium]|nr:site-2 protease family protein [Clostridia bacterium]
MIFEFFRYPVDMLYEVFNKTASDTIGMNYYYQTVSNLSDGFLSALAFVCAILCALVLHEISHGFVAYKCGDDTAKRMGRLSLNPLKHLDPIGTLCMVFVGFGWAKPVPINPVRFDNYTKGLRLVSVAGVTMNFILSFLSTGFFFLVRLIVSSITLTQGSVLYYLLYFLYIFFKFGAILNLFLMFFNLLPIYPLDGYRLLETFFRVDNKFLLFLRKYGMYILIGFVALGYISSFIGVNLNVISIALNWAANLVIKVFSLFWGLIF